MGMLYDLLLNNDTNNVISLEVENKNNIDELRLVYNDFYKLFRFGTINYIDMVSLFNNIQLNEDVPYMQFFEKNNNLMIYKIHKKESDTLSQQFMNFI